MSDLVKTTGEDIVPTRADHAFDSAPLEAWMREKIDGFDGGLIVKQFKGGQSNPTFKLETPLGDFVLRRKPPGKLLKGAHAIEREARVQMALNKVGFPVPNIRGLCEDDSLIGSAFYVMDLVKGRIIWDTTFSDIAREERPAYFNAMNETLARLHRIDFKEIGLEGYGREGGFVARQIARWSKQYEADADDAGRDPFLEKLIDWLSIHLPAEDESCITHGDYRCDNMVFHPHEPRVMAVLDWELSTIGHPLADFAYHAMIYRISPHMAPGLAGVDLTAMNLPTEKEYVAAYCARTGRPDAANFEYYLTFNMFRFAAIYHGIRGRVARGAAASPEALEKTRHMSELAELAWRQTGA